MRFFRLHFAKLPLFARNINVVCKIRDFCKINRLEFGTVKLVDFGGFKLFPTTMSGTYLIFNAIMAMALKNRTK